MGRYLTRAEQKEIKIKWSEQYLRLEEIVNEWDPIGLIRGGAPKDEYDCLTTQLLSRLYGGEKVEDIRRFVFEELDEHFGYGLNKIRCDYKSRFIEKTDKYVNKIWEWYTHQR